MLGAKGIKQIYSEITEEQIDQLESGICPYHKKRLTFSCATYVNLDMGSHARVEHGVGQLAVWECPDRDVKICTICTDTDGTRYLTLEEHLRPDTVSGKPLRVSDLVNRGPREVFRKALAEQLFNNQLF
jgi:hypothetical protein